MYCKNCGKEMNKEAQFCFNCGTKIEYQNKEFDSIDFELIPKFNFLYKFIDNLLKIIFYLLFLILVFVSEKLSGPRLESSILFPIIWFIVLTIYALVKTIIEKEQHKTIKYTFYKTKVEYKIGFIHLEQKELKYENIKEVTLSQNILERMFNLGTIKLFTNASNNKNGIYIHCIENVEEQYRIIKQIIEK